MGSNPTAKQANNPLLPMALVVQQDLEQKLQEHEGCSGGSYEDGWEKLKVHTTSMRSALEERSAETELDSTLTKLVSEYFLLYSEFSRISAQNGFSGPKSPLVQSALAWLGGWRPTSALVLVNSVFDGDFLGRPSTSAAFETHISEVSENQLSSLSNLQKHTQQTEHHISNQLAIFQMALADQTMVKAFLSEDNSIKSADSEARELIKSKIHSLAELLKQAENLRLETLRELLNLLKPEQAARFCIAFFDMAFALKTWSNPSSRNSFSLPPSTDI